MEITGQSAPLICTSIENSHNEHFFFFFQIWCNTSSFDYFPFFFLVKPLYLHYPQSQSTTDSSVWDCYIYDSCIFSYPRLYKQLNLHIWNILLLLSLFVFQDHWKLPSFLFNLHGETPCAMCHHLQLCCHS